MLLNVFIIYISSYNSAIYTNITVFANIHGNKFSFFHKMICKHNVMELY